MIELRAYKSREKDHEIELARLRLKLKKAETARDQARKKYKGLLDEMRKSPERMEQQLAEYKELSDQREEDLRDQQVTWQQTNEQLMREIKVLAEDEARHKEKMVELEGELDG